jgi:hypothetical protein
MIKELLGDRKFVETFKDDVITSSMDENTKKDILKASLRCIFGGPSGVRTMPETKPHLHIKNNKNWRPFCKSLLDHLEHLGLTKGLEEHSSMFLTFGKFWPACDAELKIKVDEAAAASKK